jgi:hypothetical protein
VTDPTHDMHYTDLMFSSHNEFVLSCTVDIPFSTSIHSSIEMHMQLPGNRADDNNSNILSDAPEKLDFDKIDHAGFARELLFTDWSTVFDVNDSIDFAWDQFSRLLMSLISKYTPKKLTVNRKVNYDRLPADIMKLIRDKKVAWRIYKKFRRETDKNTFRALAKLVRVRIDAHRKEREERILKSASIQQFYAYVRGHINSSTQIGPIHAANGAILTSDSEKAEAFNRFFHSVFTEDDANCPDFACRTTTNMNMPHFTPDEIRAALAALKNSSSCGPDGCPTKILKLFPELSLPLTDIFNMSMKQQRIPMAWKQTFLKVKF